MNPTIVQPQNSQHITPKQAVLPNSWYHNSSCRPFDLQEISKDTHKCSVAIIGGGFTGVGAALNLSKNNIDTIVIEAHEIGSGASGRNGGLVCSGYRHDQKWFEDKVGLNAAQQLWDISQAAKAHLGQLIFENKIQADYENGLLFCAHKPSLLNWLNEDMAHLNKNYSYDALKCIDKDECATITKSEAYFGGVLDMGAGRIHPLKLIYGMAAAANKYGARFFEKTRANSVLEKNGKVHIQTENGEIIADKLLICGDGYLNGINSKIEAKVLPIGSFVIATEPLNQEFLNGAIGAMDTRFVVNYWQKTFDNRLLFGGGEKYTLNWPKDIASFVRQNLVKIYPQFEKVKIEYAWGGALGISATRLPYVRQISPNVLTASGYSGQGVLLAPFFGHILGDAIMGELSKFQIIDKLPVPDFPGGRFLRFPLLTAAMSYYSILDKLP